MMKDGFFWGYFLDISINLEFNDSKADDKNDNSAAERCTANFLFYFMDWC